MASYLSTYVDQPPHRLGISAKLYFLHYWFSNHFISAGQGYDNVTLSGGNGNDSIHGYGDCNVLKGYSGNDVIIVENGCGSVDGGNGNDTLRGGAVSDILKGENGNDHIAGNGGDDTVDGGRGNDVIWGGIGNDMLVDASGANTIYGDEGDDTIYSQSTHCWVEGGTGDDVLLRLPFSTVSGGTGDDLITSSDWVRGYSSLSGDDGADTIFGRSADTVRGGSGDDVLGCGTNWGVDIYGDDGNDTISAYGSADIWGGDGADEINFSHGYHDTAFVRYDWINESSRSHPDLITQAERERQYIDLRGLLIDLSLPNRGDWITGARFHWAARDSDNSAGAMHLIDQGGGSYKFYFMNVERAENNTQKHFQIDFTNSNIDRSNFLF